MNTDLTDAEHITDLSKLYAGDSVTALSPDLLTEISGPVIHQIHPFNCWYIKWFTSLTLPELREIGWTIYRTKKAGPELPVEDGWYFSESRGYMLYHSLNGVWFRNGNTIVSLSEVAQYLPLTKMEPREQTLREVIEYLRSEGWKLIVTRIKNHFGLDVK